MSSQSTKLSGHALELAKQVSREWGAMFKDVAQIEKQAEADILARKTLGGAAVKEGMHQIFDALHIPLEERSNYSLNATYLSRHGDAYMDYHGPDKEPPPETILVPTDKSRLN